MENHYFLKEKSCHHNSKRKGQKKIAGKRKEKEKRSKEKRKRKEKEKENKKKTERKEKKMKKKLLPAVLEDNRR